MINNIDCPKCGKRPAEGFKKNLHFYRKLKKISCRELAESCNISYQMISKYECGLRTPTPLVLVLLAQKLTCLGSKSCTGLKSIKFGRFQGTLWRK
ncbi:MAG: helix-turn-helix transcriptional regulator [Oscillospiraceae bacterium]|nr:helix-turn-helix transcriptional regulator [Oscillospiraceae bacterium]